jgi:predicted ABC-type ATPase
VPVFTVFAGPNGAGKSTVIKLPEFESRRTNLLEADAIAKRMDPADPLRAAVAAGREVILRTREYLRTRQNFAMETTFSGTRTLVTMREARSEGFRVELVYVGLVDSDYCIRRVRERVAQGGHFVPDDDVKRRYARSVTNLASALGLADKVTVYDNSDVAIRKVLEAAAGVIHWRAENEPAWITSVLAQIPK